MASCHYRILRLPLFTQLFEMCTTPAPWRPTSTFFLQLVILVLQVDCTEDGKDTCSRFGVSGYPTLKIFKSGDLSSDYNGPREASEWCRKANWFAFMWFMKQFGEIL